MHYSNYTAENICRALGLAGFANDWQLAGAERGIRVLLAYSDFRETCLTFVDDGSALIVTVLVAHSNIWQQEWVSPKPTPVDEACGSIALDDFEMLSELLNQANIAPQPNRVTIHSHGFTHSVMRANGLGVTNINGKDADKPEHSEFVRHAVKVAWNALSEPRIRNALRDICVGDSPVMEVPPKKDTIRTLVLGPDEAVGDLIGALKNRHEEKQSTVATSLQTSPLRGLIRDCDAILLDVLEVVGQQVVAKPMVVYSKRFEGTATYSAERLSFVGAPGSWGNVTLKPGERALVFLKCLPGGRLYQHHLHGHFTVTEINGTLHAIANWDFLQSGASWEPTFLFDAAFYPNPDKKWQVAGPYALLERHLEDELKAIG